MLEPQHTFTEHHELKAAFLKLQECIFTYMEKECAETFAKSLEDFTEAVYLLGQCKAFKQAEQTKKDIAAPHSDLKPLDNPPPKGVN